MNERARTDFETKYPDDDSPLRRMAPELFEWIGGEGSRTTCASDVYAFAYLCLEVCHLVLHL